MIELQQTEEIESDPEPLSMHPAVQGDFERANEKNNAVKAIVEVVDDFTKLEEGETDRFVFSRPKTLAGPLESTVYLIDYGIYHSNKYANNIHKNERDLLVAGIEIRQKAVIDDAGEWAYPTETYSVMDEDGNYVLKRHEYHAVIDSKTEKETYVETVNDATEENTKALLAFLQSMQPSR